VFALDSIYQTTKDKSDGKNSILHNIQNQLLGYNNDGIEIIDASLANGVTIEQDFLTPNEYSRPQTPLYGIDGVVIHYTANPGTTAANNRSYFEGLATTHATSASSHYVIGLEGEVIQCIPLTEISYASNDRNEDTVAIECCISDETGKFNDATYSSTVALTAALCVQFDLEERDIIRHYDITGKCCPKYFVEHEDTWLTFKSDVMAEVKHRKNKAS
jgi:N-acetylmuramoyl-L-alanine amidase CwlA